MADVKKKLKRMDPDSIEYRKLYSEQYELERQVRQDWYQKLKKNNEEVPHVMGRSALQTSKEFIEDYDRRYQQEMLARSQASGREFNIANLYAEEEKKENEYRRQEQERNRRREEGLLGRPVGGIIPAAINTNEQ